MNYEEKYNQTIESIKRIYEQADSFGKELMEKEFPELKESEDERIRKGLIKGLSAMRDIHKHQTFSDDAININDAIDWLEKQGKKQYSETYIADVFEQVGLAKIARELANDNLTNALQYAMIELSKKQSEQKPIEQDTETRDLWVYIREWNDKFGRLPKDEDELASCIDYVMKRQKPAWSEEDLEEYYKKQFLPKEWFAKPGHRTISQFNFFTAQHFAEWQKNKMKEALQTEYEKGRFDTREEMMKNAVEDCSVIFLSDNKNWLQIPGANLVKALESFKQGDKVKIIIVKTEQQ